MKSLRSPSRAAWRIARSSLCGSCRRTYATANSETSPAASAAELERARAYCANLLRHYDSPSFTLQTFIPPHARDAYLAIRAFNIDVARVADQTSNTTVGRMRMQFWRDAVARALQGSPPKEPVAVLLAHAAEALSTRTDGHARLGKAWFLRIISEREKALGNPPFANLAALESYAENTYSTLLYLTLQALPMASVTADHLASHIGKATGIATVLRGLPLIAFPPAPNHHSNQAAFGGALPGGRQGAVLLPLDIMAEAGVKEEDVLRYGAEATGLRDAVFAVATRANDHLITARSMLSSLHAGGEVDHDFEHVHEEEHRYSPQQLSAGTHTQLQDVERGFGALMPAVATGLWLEKLQKMDFDVFNPKLRTTDWKLPWRAYWAFRQKKI
ncbi:Squalene/phytoene synthase [Macrophomina phaseolina MS6]|uniref:Squalene/phytoene synthase n=1 Tax=Macrophomina phaseolina (strain MS6) TaxID=1126212 RepID=K2R2P2_MACPH|nr:Squalene/phytoene synthase [Macrophomina phaseolina MS6]